MNLCKTKWQQKWIDLDIIHPKLQELADLSAAFCGRWYGNIPDKSLLVISGETGCGKTHVARKIYDFCKQAGMNAMVNGKWGETKLPDSTFISWPEAANQFNEKNIALMRDAIECELCVLDDVGAENDPWKICADKLCQILSRRERKFTVLTTNIPPKDWAQSFDIRINDRLLRNSIVMDLTGVGSYALKN